jgi:hypothetical protein
MSYLLKSQSFKPSHDCNIFENILHGRWTNKEATAISEALIVGQQIQFL